MYPLDINLSYFVWQFTLITSLASTAFSMKPSRRAAIDPDWAGVTLNTIIQLHLKLIAQPFRLCQTPVYNGILATTIGSVLFWM